MKMYLLSSYKPAKLYDLQGMEHAVFKLQSTQIVFALQLTDKRRRRLGRLLYLIRLNNTKEKGELMPLLHAMEGGGDM